MKENRLFLCGYYGCGNLGDDALLYALCGEIGRRAPQVGIFYLSGGAKRTERAASETGAVAVPRNPIAVRRAICTCDALVFGGGSILQNVTSTASLYAYLALLGEARRRGKKTAILAGGIGPVAGKLPLRATAEALRALDYASFRDVEAVRFARALGVQNPILSADPALLLRPAPYRISLPDPFLLVSLRRKTERSDAEGAARRIFTLAERKGLTPVLLDLFPREDADFTAVVARSLSRLYRAHGKTTAAWTLPPLSPQKLLAVTSRASYVLTGRYHLALFAYRAGVPFSVAGDDPKLRAVTSETRPAREATACVGADIAALLRAVL